MIPQREEDDNLTRAIAHLRRERDELTAQINALVEKRDKLRGLR
jgi:uncharacterized coiled-coil DUF342 family protein